MRWGIVKSMFFGTIRKEQNFTAVNIFANTDNTTILKDLQIQENFLIRANHCKTVLYSCKGWLHFLWSQVYSLQSQIHSLAKSGKNPCKGRSISCKTVLYSCKGWLHPIFQRFGWRAHSVYNLKVIFIPYYICKFAISKLIFLTTKIIKATKIDCFTIYKVPKWLTFVFFMLFIVKENYHRRW